MYHRQFVEAPEEYAKNRNIVALRLVGYLTNYWPAVSIALFLTIVNAIAQGVGPFLIGRAIDEFISHGDKSGLTQIMITLIVVYIIGMFSMRYQIYFMSYAGQQVLADLRKNIIDCVESLSLGYIEGEESGDLMSRLVNDIDAINNFLSQGLAQSVGSLFSLIGIVIAMFLLNWQLALAALIIVPLMLIATRIFSLVARRAFRKTRETIGDVSAELQEEIVGVKVSQAFDRGDLNIRRFAERNAANRDANVSANAVTSAFAPTMDVLSTLDTAIVAGYGGYLAVTGVITVGVVVSFLQYVQNFFRPIQTISQIWTQSQAAFAAAERVFGLFDTEPDIQDSLNAIEIDKLTGEVKFINVNFSYDADRSVLYEINLTAQPGETIAVVGPTGAGKSTLVSLIPRFYDVESGSITLDGRNIRSVTQHSLRSHMAMVNQDPFLFSGSVMENIRYGRLNATDDELFAAAKAANAHDFISRLSNGYQTEVGERGNLLSLGQRQLITIARAILANPRILILDEATASVDTRTEVLIQRALGRLLRDRTSFVIAHRLSTVRNADQVLVLDEGRIVECGTHEELISQGGVYAELYRRQFYSTDDLEEIYTHSLAD